MAYNIHYMDQDADVALHRVRDHQYNDEYMIATLGDLALNCIHEQIVDLHSVDTLEKRESFDMRSLLKQNQY